jgi:hypothetical protein
MCKSELVLEAFLSPAKRESHIEAISKVSQRKYSAWDNYKWLITLIKNILIALVPKQMQSSNELLKMNFKDKTTRKRKKRKTLEYLSKNIAMFWDTISNCLVVGWENFPRADTVHGMKKQCNDAGYKPERRLYSGPALFS